jgi:hypothetical protein
MKIKMFNVRLLNVRLTGILVRIGHILFYRVVVDNAELLYERLFANKLNSLGLENEYFGIGSAANYSYLYLISRIVGELNVKNILELGAGESTRLLNSMSTVRDINITTLEEDKVWAERIASKVSHQIVHAPLSNYSVFGKLTKGYGNVLHGEKFDMMLIDGPIGTRRNSRFCSIEYVFKNLSINNFVIVLDDVNRKGEQDTLKAILEELDSRSIQYQYKVKKSVKFQAVIASGRFIEAVYF